MELSFKDKVALITGGTRGIGRTIAENFARRGATTLITYASSSTQADELVGLLRKEGCIVHAYKVDIKNTEAMDEMIEGIAKEFGKIDILVNNAGIVRDTLILTMDKDAWTDVITTNLTGAYNTIRPISRLMLRKRNGAIINMSSIAASKPGRGHSNYAASKGGIEALTRALAAELGGKGVRVNCVAPGMIETEMSKAVRDAAGELILDSIVLKRYGSTQDIANAVMFLASDMSSYITGEVLHVDGGIRG